MADETVQEIPDPMKAEPGAPIVLDPDGNPPSDQAPPAPDIADDPAPEPAPVDVDQPTSPPVIDADNPLFSRFRKLWNGGERRAAVEWAKVEQVAEDEWAALMGEFPELLDIINGN